MVSPVGMVMLSSLLLRLPRLIPWGKNLEQQAIRHLELCRRFPTFTFLKSENLKSVLALEGERGQPFNTWLGPRTQLELVVLVC